MQYPNIFYAPPQPKCYYQAFVCYYTDKQHSSMVGANSKYKRIKYIKIHANIVNGMLHWQLSLPLRRKVFMHKFFTIGMLTFKLSNSLS